MKNKRIENVLDQISFECEMSEDQSKLFTPCHVRVVATFTNDETGFTFKSDYQYNPNYTNCERDDVLSALIVDSDCYLSTMSDNDIDSLDYFAYEFGGGYEKVSDCIKAWRACKYNYNNLCDLLGAENVEDLRDYYMEKGMM